MPAGELTPKQEAFVREYLKDSNGTQAAIRAGYSEHTANEQSSQLLAKLNIQNRLAELKKPIVEAAGLTLKEHLESLKQLRDSAKTAEQYSAAVTAETNRGKAAGLYITKVEDVTVDKDKLADLIFEALHGTH